MNGGVGVTGSSGSGQDCCSRDPNQANTTQLLFDKAISPGRVMDLDILLVFTDCGHETEYLFAGYETLRKTSFSDQRFPRRARLLLATSRRTKIERTFEKETEKNEIFRDTERSLMHVQLHGRKGYVGEILGPKGSGTGKT